MEYINKKGTKRTGTNVPMSQKENLFMEERFEREYKIFELSEDEKNTQLIKSIIKTKEHLMQAHQNFEYADSDLIDYYSYNIKADTAKLNYLIKQAKLRG